MDRRSKHLSSEERGVIFAEHYRGNSQQGIGRLLGNNGPYTNEWGIFHSVTKVSIIRKAEWKW